MFMGILSCFLGWEYVVVVKYVYDERVKWD